MPSLVEFLPSLALLPLKLGFRFGSPLTNNAHLVGGWVFVFLRGNALLPGRAMAGNLGRELLPFVFVHIRIVPLDRGLQKGSGPQQALLAPCCGGFEADWSPIWAGPERKC